MAKRVFLSLLLSTALVLGGCPDDDDDTTTDTQQQDTTVQDTTVADTMVADTMVADTTVADTTVADTTVADTTVADTTVADVADVADSTVADTTVADTTMADAADAAETVTAGCASELFFSEYIEGSSNNKALEIANFTGEPVNLGDYEIVSLGNVDVNLTWAADGESDPLPTVVLPHGEVFVICNSGSAQAIKDVCDWVAQLPVFFNGNDARALAKGDTILDTIGAEDEAVSSSGWKVGETDGGTKEHTLVRKATVDGPTTDWAAASASEWTVLDQDDFTDLGTHTFGYSCTATSASDDVVINEVFVSGSPWVELYNNTGAVVDLAGWTLDDAQTAYAIPSGTIAASGYLVIDTSDFIDLNLSVDGGAVELRDASGILADATGWEAGDADEGTSWGRLPDGTGDFRTLDIVTEDAMNAACDDGTCQASETCGTCPEDCDTCPDVVINEIVPVPSSGSAFVELFNNNTTAAADVSGWFLDANASYEIPMSTSVPAGGYLVIEETASTLGLLATDSLSLLESGGVQQDSTSWDGLGTDVSWSRFPDGTGIFQESNTTKGAANVGVANDCATDLFISEYVEPDGGNNKVIEIANFTGVEVDLSGYLLWGVQNGGTWPEDTLALSGTLAHGEVFVYCNPSADEALPCDQDVSGNLFNFNGDDARALVKAGGTPEIIDVIGTDGADPGSGWDVGIDANATANHTLRRLGTVSAPNADWASSSASEWDVLDANTLDGLGSHAYGGDCP